MTIDALREVLCDNLDHIVGVDTATVTISSDDEEIIIGLWGVIDVKDTLEELTAAFDEAQDTHDSSPVVSSQDTYVMLGALTRIQDSIDELRGMITEE